jgi:hypothetical protein
LPSRIAADKPPKPCGDDDDVRPRRASRWAVALGYFRLLDNAIHGFRQFRSVIKSMLVANPVHTAAKRVGTRFPPH